ncbi:MAG: hypothetical protein WAM17_08795 [Rhodoplanes sp.]
MKLLIGRADDEHCERQIERTADKEEICVFAAEWYRKLDEHVPANELVPMIADRGLEFHLPETVLRNRDDFCRWYAGGGDLPGVVNVFFDEQHTLSRIVASRVDDRSRVAVVVNWQARRWKPPEPHSQWIGYDAYQTLGDGALPLHGKARHCPLRS